AGQTKCGDASSDCSRLVGPRLGSQLGRSRLVRLLQESNASRGEIVYSAYQLHVAPHRAGLPSGDSCMPQTVPTHVGTTRPAQLRADLFGGTNARVDAMRRDARFWPIADECDVRCRPRVCKNSARTEMS